MQIRSSLCKAYQLWNEQAPSNLRSDCKLAILNSHPHSEAGPSLLHHLIGLHALPKSIAVDHNTGHEKQFTLSYSDFDEKTSLLASQITRKLETLPERTSDQIIVPILLPHSVELYVSTVAVLKAGAAFCPLSLEAPTQRLQFIIKDVGASVILTDPVLAQRLGDGHGCSIITSIILNESNDAVPRTSSSSSVKPDDTAYIMYTSGTTGMPKGVALSHRAVSQALLAHQKHIPSYSRFLQFAAPTFDVSVFEMFFTWFRGATLVSCDRSILLDDLSEFIQRADIDAAELTPTVAGTLLGSRKDVPKLSVLLTIGEMLTESIIEEFGESHDRPGILHGLYGPTEAAIHCTLAPKFGKNLKRGIIGRPLQTV